MKIRELTADDAAAYRELRLFMLTESPAAFGSSYAEVAGLPLAQFVERLEDPQNYHFGAFDEEELVGVTTLRLTKRPKLRHKASLFAVYVRPENRRRGAGRALVQAALDRARGLGVRQVNLGVSHAGKAAVRLYESCGFEQYGLEEDAFYVDGRFYDVAYMACRLGDESAA